jgi:hypothetical protein
MLCYLVIIHCVGFMNPSTNKLYTRSEARALPKSYKVSVLMQHLGKLPPYVRQTFIDWGVLGCPVTKERVIK